MVIPTIVLVALVLAAGLLIGFLVAQRNAAAAAPALGADQLEAEREAVVAAALDAARSAVRAERAESLQQTVDTVLSVASSKLGDQLAAGKQVIDREHEVVGEQVRHVHGELRRVTELVASLQAERAEQNGALNARLEQAVAATAALTDTTLTLRDALASPKARGQWGERMAEDVLRTAGFVEGVNYVKQQKLAGGGIPDYSFDLPMGHAVHMDVKFPIDNYLRWLDADDDALRAQLAKQFGRDVRQRVKELTDRSYIDPATTVDYLLLFIPNESVYGFIHEHDPDLVDAALTQKVVLCSPTSLFAVLAVIRQAVDNFMVERRSDEILAAIGGLRDQWDRLGQSMDKVGRGLESAQKAYDDARGTRFRQFNRRLTDLEQLRDGAEAGPASSPPALERSDDGSLDTQAQRPSGPRAGTLRRVG